MAALAAELGRLFLGVKGAGLYQSDPVFHTKVTLFLSIGVLSAWPTLRFLR